MKGARAHETEGSYKSIIAEGKMRAEKRQDGLALTATRR